MKVIINTYFSHFSNKDYIKSFVFAIILLVVSLVVSFYASLYATKMASSSVTDIVLSNIRVYDVDIFFVYGPWVWWVTLSLLTMLRPHRIPFMVKNIALFLLVRSFFITLTHIGPFPTAILIEPTKLSTLFTSTGDLFFSAHTGAPFLMALVFWNDKIYRYVLLAVSVFFGIIVLLGHLHYTIDVVAAFFITYSIYSMASLFFKNDKLVFNEEKTVV